MESVRRRCGPARGPPPRRDRGVERGGGRLDPAGREQAELDAVTFDHRRRLDVGLEGPTVAARSLQAGTRPARAARVRHGRRRRAGCARPGGRRAATGRLRRARRPGHRPRHRCGSSTRPGASSPRSPSTARPPPMGHGGGDRRRPGGPAPGLRRAANAERSRRRAHRARARPPTPRCRRRSPTARARRRPRRGPPNPRSLRGGRRGCASAASSVCAMCSTTSATSQPVQREGRCQRSSSRRAIRPQSSACCSPSACCTPPPSPRP